MPEIVLAQVILACEHLLEKLQLSASVTILVPAKVLAQAVKPIRQQAGEERLLQGTSCSRV